MSNKLYTVAGFSTLNGQRKFRVANNLKARIARLKYCGHTEIELVELPEAMTREAAEQWVELQKQQTTTTNEQAAREARNSRRRLQRQLAKMKTNDFAIMGSAMHQPA